MAKTFPKKTDRPQRPIQTLTDEEGTMLLEQLHTPPKFGPTRKHYLRNYTMALLMLDAGLRIGELVQIKKGYVIFAGEFTRNIEVPAAITKNHRERSIPMTERLRGAVKAMDEAYWLPDECPPDGFCFYLKDWHKPITVRQVERIIATAGWAALHKRIWPHVLRHTFATRLMSKTSIRVVQQLLGHSSVTSTQIYTHVNNQDCEKAIKGIEGVVEDSPDTPSAKVRA